MYHSYHYDVFNIKIRMNSVSTVCCTCVRPSRSCVLNLKCNSEKETVENEDNMLVVTNLSMKVSAGFCSNPPPPPPPSPVLFPSTANNNIAHENGGEG